MARCLLPLLPGTLAYLEGDAFWSFIAKPVARSRREDFPVIMRAMAAAAVPFVRSGFDVLLDFSIPPEFLPTARKVLKEIQTGLCRAASRSRHPHSGRAGRR